MRSIRSLVEIHNTRVHNAPFSSRGELFVYDIKDLDVFSISTPASRYCPYHDSGRVVYFDQCKQIFRLGENGDIDNKPSKKGGK